MIIKKFENEVEAEKFIHDFIQYCGSLHSLYHLRDMDKDSYETIVIGENKTLVLYGGLRSGEDTAGSKALVRVLEFLGTTNEDAEQIVLNDTSSVHIIKVELN